MFPNKNFNSCPILPKGNDHNHSPRTGGMPPEPVDLILVTRQDAFEIHRKIVFGERKYFLLLPNLFIRPEFSHRFQLFLGRGLVDRSDLPDPDEGVLTAGRDEEVGRGWPDGEEGQALDPVLVAGHLEMKFRFVLLCSC
jgi:hypothetical protein